MRQYPHELSGGMRQRVTIAIALLLGPALIVADEPTTALDVTIQAQILKLMKRLCRESGAALVWITHDIGVVSMLADRVLVMYAGRVVECGPVAEVLDAPRHPYTAGLLSSMPGRRDRAQGLATIPGMMPSLLQVPTGCAFRTRCALAAEICATPPPEWVSGSRSALCHKAG